MSPRMPVEYAALGIADLEQRLRDLADALDFGAQTGVAVSSGRTHTFRGLSPEQLEARKNKVALALHLKWLELHPDDDASANPYPDPAQSRVMRVTTVFE